MASLSSTGRADATSIPAVGEFTNLPGSGVTGVVRGDRYEIGRPSVDVEIGPGQTVVELRRGDDVLGHIAVADTPKPTSATAVARFRELGLEPVLLTGDNAATARSVADAVGIDEVRAEVLPADKVAVVSELQQRGRTVAMVGDGVNDAAALAQADLGISMGSGTDVAIEASDLTLVRDDLTAAADAIRLSRRTLGTIKGNLFWAFAYNVVAILVAMSGRLSRRRRRRHGVLERSSSPTASASAASAPARGRIRFVRWGQAPSGIQGHGDRGRAARRCLTPSVG
ncbi:MAG: HAD-IC family P-type ATPase [Ilumatobacteraceae bacterium]